MRANLPFPAGALSDGSRLTVNWDVEPGRLPTRQNGCYLLSQRIKARRAKALRAQQAEAVDELQVREPERLDALQRSCRGAAVAGDIPAVDRVLRVIAARVRLLGLDQLQDKAASGGGRLVCEAWQPEAAEVGSG